MCLSLRDVLTIVRVLVHNYVVEKLTLSTATWKYFFDRFSGNSIWIQHGTVLVDW